MDLTSGPFTISRVVWRTAAGGNIGAPNKQLRVGVLSVDARCNECGDSFTAGDGGEKKPGMFRSYANGIALTCPSGEHSATISTRDLETSSR